MGSVPRGGVDGLGEEREEVGWEVGGDGGVDDLFLGFEAAEVVVGGRDDPKDEVLEVGEGVERECNEVLEEEEGLKVLEEMVVEVVRHHPGHRREEAGDVFLGQASVLDEDGQRDGEEDRGLGVDAEGGDSIEEEALEAVEDSILDDPLPGHVLEEA